MMGYIMYPIMHSQIALQLIVGAETQLNSGRKAQLNTPDVLATFLQCSHFLNRENSIIGALSDFSQTVYSPFCEIWWGSIWSWLSFRKNAYYSECNFVHLWRFFMNHKHICNARRRKKEYLWFIRNLLKCAWLQEEKIIVAFASWNINGIPALTWCKIQTIKLCYITDSRIWGLLCNFLVGNNINLS